MQTMKKAIWILIVVSIVLSIVFFRYILNPDKNLMNRKDVTSESAPAEDPFVFTLPEPLQNKSSRTDFPGWELADIPVPADFNWKKYSGTTLNFIVENNIHANILTKESQKFTEETGIQINIRPMDYNTMLEKISLDLITQRNKYQLIYVDPYQTLNRFHNDLEDLDVYTSRSDLPQIPGGLEDFNPEHTRVLSYFANEERLLAIPFDTTTMILFYRQDIFDKYRDDFMLAKGYDWTPGKNEITWDQYIEISEWITDNVPKDEVRYGSAQMAQSHNSLYCDFSNIMAAYGANYFGDAAVSTYGIDIPTEVTINTPEFRNALEAYQRIVLAGAPDSLEWNWFDTAEAFMNGELAMMANWDENWAAVENPSISKVSGQVGYSVLPTGSHRSGNIFGGSGIGINKYASQLEKEAAWLFIVWATSPKTELTVFVEPQGGNVPSRQSLYKNILSSEILDDKPGDFGNSVLQFSAVVSAWQPENIYYRPKIKVFYEIEMTIIEELRSMLTTEQNPADTAEIMQDKIEQIIRRHR